MSATFQLQQLAIVSSFKLAHRNKKSFLKPTEQLLFLSDLIYCCASDNLVQICFLPDLFFLPQYDNFYWNNTESSHLTNTFQSLQHNKPFSMGQNINFIQRRLASCLEINTLSCRNFLLSKYLPENLINYISNFTVVDYVATVGE